MWLETFSQMIEQSPDKSRGRRASQGALSCADRNKIVLGRHSLSDPCKNKITNLKSKYFVVVVF